MILIKDDDGLLFPGLDPKVTRNPCVMLIHLPITLGPIVKFAPGDLRPREKLPGGKLGQF
jgi:hypothetical protein